MTPGPPAPAAILSAAAAAGRPWFPADFAADTGTPRDDLYDPVTALVNAGLLAVADWQKGRGQAYRPTEAGAAVAHDPAAVAKLLAGTAVSAPLPAAREPGLTTFDRGEMARAALLTPRPPVVVPALLLANAVWFLVGVYFAQQAGTAANYLRYGDAPVLHRLGGVSGADLLRGESWRLVSAAFVHGGGLHLLLNMYALSAVGSAAEAVWGRWRFGAIYACAALAGSCLAMALNPASLTVGASGAILGLNGALAGWLLLNREFIPPEQFFDWSKSLLISGIVCIGVSLAPRVSWEAHLGGAAAGFVAAVLANAVRPGLARKRVVAAAAFLLCLLPAACVLGVTWAMESSDAWAGLKLREKAKQETAVRTVVAPIHPGAVESAYLAVLVKRDRAGAALLLQKATAAAATLRSGTDGEPLRSASAEYADRVREVAQGLLAPKPDWDKLFVQKKAAIAAWK